MTELEHLIKLSKEVARAWRSTAIILAILLVLSVAGNIYLACQGVEITFGADNNNESEIHQTNGK